jgi:hypothetical protein
MKVYVAASWRTPQQPEVVRVLREAGHEVYDFRNPPNKSGFGWEQVQNGWTPGQPITAAQYVWMVHHPIADAGFGADMKALREADAVVLLQPSGRSAALEFGYAIGAGKLGIVLLADHQEPELMLRMADAFAFTLEEVLLRLAVSIAGELGPCACGGRALWDFTVPDEDAVYVRCVGPCFARVEGRDLVEAERRWKMRRSQVATGQGAEVAAT